MATVYAARQDPGGQTLKSNVPISDATAAALRAKTHPTRLSVTSYTADGAIPVAEGIAVLTKTSAAAMTVAAPVSGTDDGLVVEIVGGTDFAHVVTFTGTTLLDGTTGANLKWTSAAFIGSALRAMAMTGKWLVLTNNLGVITTS